MKTETINCKTCGAEIQPLNVFPGKICISCHEKKFNAAVARNGGILPRPDFSKVVSPMKAKSPNPDSWKAAKMAVAFETRAVKAEKMGCAKATANLRAKAEMWKNKADQLAK